MATRSSNAGRRTRSQASNIPTDLSSGTANRRSRQCSTKKAVVTRRNKRAASSDDANDHMYEVESIVKMKEAKTNGITERRFLVAWVGYDERTWEPECNLKPHMVEEYIRNLKSATTKGKSGEATVEPTPNSDNVTDNTALGDSDSPLVSLHAFTANDAVTPEAEVGTQDVDGEAVEAETGTDANDDVSETQSADPGANTTKRSARQVDVKSDDDSSEDDEERYEVDRILRMETMPSEGLAVKKFLVAWVGYDETTWEPEENLPNDMVSEFINAAEKSAESRRKSPLSQAQRSTGIMCATCGDGPDGLGSSCARCKLPMHHFCATEVCESLGLKDANGDSVLEFPNDTCYCSKTCFEGRPGAVRTSKQKRKRKLPDDSESEFDAHEHDMEGSDDNEGGDSGRDEGDWGQTNTKTKAAPPKKATKKTAKKTVERGAKRARDQINNEVTSLEEWPPRKTKKVPKKDPPEAPKTRDPLVGRMVAFCADREEWMSSKLYKETRGLFLSGRIHIPKLAKGQRRSDDDIYEVRWTVTNYQKAAFFHRIPRAKVEEGIENYKTISGGALNKATWKHICQVPDSEAQVQGENLDDYVVLDGTSDVFVSHQMIPANLELVEKIVNLDFQPSKRMQEPPDLFAHDDGTTETKLIKDKRHHFETASSSFLAYLPVSFWNKVVEETNEYAEPMKGKTVTLDELMRFFGILFYMTIVDKGEYSNYWGEQAEDEIFGYNSKDFGLDKLMTLKRFQYIRKNLSFRCNVSAADLKKDPAARIRPLLNMIKFTSTKYVHLGRNVAVDESSVACRSKFGRHLIVYNSAKPTGKFHFKIYACCCATTWLMVGFRLHCASDMEDRLKGVVSAQDARYLDDRLQFSSSVRQIVLEVTQPIHNTHRVVNTDNFYTSVTLLLSLRDVGLYGRGTIRENSAHFPKAHMFAKKADEPRGSSLQGVSNTGEMIAASWMDGSAVNIISNADSSTMGEVTRLIGKEHVVFPAPKCVSEYNKHMQGVDRLDQLRAKYSLADGHSMQKWHKKLALAFIDIARVNAYVTKCMRNDTDAKPQRNAHRQFMIELASELITGKWRDSVEDEGMLFADDQLSTATMSVAGSPGVVSPQPSAACDFVLSKERFPKATRGKRGCKVCAFEGRQWTMKSIYCTRHNICLCTNTYPVNQTLEAVVCTRTDWNCWRKFHEFYLPRGVFNGNGKIKRSSKIFQACRKLKLDTEELATAALTTTDSNTAPESPPTLVFSPFDPVRANTELLEASSPEFDRALSPPSTDSVQSPSRLVRFEEYLSPRDIVSVATSSDYGDSYSVEI